MRGADPSEHGVTATPSQAGVADTASGGAKYRSRYCTAGTTFCPGALTWPGLPAPPPEPTALSACGALAAGVLVLLLAARPAALAAFFSWFINSGWATAWPGVRLFSTAVGQPCARFS